METFNKDLPQNFDQGQANFSDSIKMLIYKRQPELFDKLDFDNESIFLEPLLFTFFISKKTTITLEQILYGYISLESRPIELMAYADANSIIYLPQIGYLKSPIASSIVSIKYVKEHLFEVSIGEGKTVNSVVEPIVYVITKRIEVCRYLNPLVEQVMSQWPAFKNTENFFPFDIEIEYPKIIRAFDIIKNNCSSDYEMFIQSTKKIVLFSNPELRSFVSRSMHGTIFLNLLTDRSIPFYIDEIIHQCSHNVFNSVTADVKEYFSIDATTPLKSFTKLEKDTRSIYDAFHGQYTTFKCMDTMIQCLKDETISPEEKHELLGRIGVNEKRFKGGLRISNTHEVFTSRGAELHSTLLSASEELIQNESSIFGINDFSNQPHVFRYSLFLQKNPLAHQVL